MDCIAFYENVRSHNQLTWRGVTEGENPTEDAVFIGGPYGKFSVTIAGIKEASWEDLEAVFMNQRSPTVMTHVTRIVGYYSQLQNWNKSKIAELHDRHKGDYGVSEDSSEAPASTRVA